MGWCCALCACAARCRAAPRAPASAGRDLDVADVQVVGFGDRELRFGEGPIVQSPRDPSRLLGIQHPSEDDVLHADHLPTFGEVLAPEEAEELMCYLTVDYIRIPLVLGFFASQDRAIYLFNTQLQVCPRQPPPESTAQRLASRTGRAVGVAMCGGRP